MDYGAQHSEAAVPLYSPPTEGGSQPASTPHSPSPMSTSPGESSAAHNKRPAPDGPASPLDAHVSKRVRFAEDIPTPADAFHDEHAAPSPDNNAAADAYAQSYNAGRDAEPYTPLDTPLGTPMPETPMTPATPMEYGLGTPGPGDDTERGTPAPDASGSAAAGPAGQRQEIDLRLLPVVEPMVMKEGDKMKKMNVAGDLDAADRAERGQDDRKRILPRSALGRVLQRLNVDDSFTISNEVQDWLALLAETMLDTTIEFASQMASRRQSRWLEARDMRVYLEHNWHLSLPSNLGPTAPARCDPGNADTQLQAAVRAAHGALAPAVPASKAARVAVVQGAGERQGEAGGAGSGPGLSPEPAQHALGEASGDPRRVHVGAEQAVGSGPSDAHAGLPPAAIVGSAAPPG